MRKCKWQAVHYVALQGTGAGHHRTWASHEKMGSYTDRKRLDLDLDLIALPVGELSFRQGSAKSYAEEGARRHILPSCDEKCRIFLCVHRFSMCRGTASAPKGFCIFARVT
jgi:hypothetical protein